MPIYQKINQVMKAVRGVEKASKNAHGKYNYAGHEAVTGALRGEFARLGIVRAAEIVSLDVIDGGAVRIAVEVSYHDTEDGSKVVLRMFALQHSQTSKGGVTAQQVGQALSYAVKNIEFKLFSLTGDTEPDTDSGSGGSGEPSATPEALEARARELLELVQAAATREEFEAVMKDARSEYRELEGVEGFALAMKVQRTNAEKRLGLSK